MYCVMCTCVLCTVYCVNVCVSESLMFVCVFILVCLSVCSFGVWMLLDVCNESNVTDKNELTAKLPNTEIICHLGMLPYTGQLNI